MQRRDCCAADNEPYDMVAHFESLGMHDMARVIAAGRRERAEKAADVPTSPPESFGRLEGTRFIDGVRKTKTTEGESDV